MGADVGVIYCSIKAKIKSGYVIGLDTVIVATSNDFNDLIAELKTKQNEHNHHRSLGWIRIRSFEIDNFLQLQRMFMATPSIGRLSCLNEVITRCLRIRR